MCLYMGRVRHSARATRPARGVAVHATSFIFYEVSFFDLNPFPFPFSLNAELGPSLGESGPDIV